MMRALPLRIQSSTGFSSSLREGLSRPVMLQELLNDH